MRKQFIYGALALIVAIGTLFSCRKKDDPVVAGQTGSLKMEFSNIVGNEPLTLRTQWYLNANGDSFKVNTYKYYISNIVLHMADGRQYAEPESYHLIDQEDLASKRFTIQNVPTGNYTSVTFLIGIDSARNTSGAQTGALDPAHGMLWTWNTGYIMAKLEAYSPRSGAIDSAVILHIAGFSGEFNVLKTVTLPFPEAAVVSAANVPNVHLFSDVSEWFKNPVNINLSRDYFIMSTGRDARRIADNYADMFRVDHVDN